MSLVVNIQEAFRCTPHSRWERNSRRLTTLVAALASAVTIMASPIVDWKAGTVTRRYEGDSRTEPVPADTQDRVSFLLALAYLSKNGQPVAFHLADGRGMSHHTYKPNGRERIATPAGEFDTVKPHQRMKGLT